MTRSRILRSPALVASVAAHVLLFAAFLIHLPRWPMQVGAAVPVTLITNAPPAELSAAEEAPEPAEAMTPEPVEEAEPQPAPPAPSPEPPAPPPPAPKPAPAPKQTPQPKQAEPAPKAPPAKATPAPSPKQPAPKQKAAQPQAKQSRDDLDLDALMASVSESRRAAAAKQASGERGPAQARTDRQARQGQGRDNRSSASEMGLFIQKLQRLWNPNCQVENAARINVRVRIRLTPEGRLSAPAEDVDGLMRSSDPSTAVAAQRALSAVGRGAPYTELNPENYDSWRDIIVTFKGSEACG